MDARAWDERYAAAPLVWPGAPHPAVESELADLPPGRALDLASGEGRHATWLAARGWRVTGLDFSAVALDKARELAGDLEVEWVHADATRWHRPAAYELVVVAYLQLPERQRRAALQRAFSALVPGGTLLVVAHDRTNLTEGTGGPQDPAVLMSATDVLDDLEGTTYDVVRAGRVARPVGTEGAGHGEQPARVAWDCLVRLVRR